MQPLVLETTTVYVPAEITARFEFALPLSHKYDPPPLAKSAILVVVQFNSLDACVIAAFGAILFAVIFIDADAVQPFAPITTTL